MYSARIPVLRELNPSCRYSEYLLPPPLTSPRPLTPQMIPKVPKLGLGLGLGLGLELELELELGFRIIVKVRVRACVRVMI